MSDIAKASWDVLERGKFDNCSFSCCQLIHIHCVERSSLNFSLIVFG